MTRTRHGVASSRVASPRSTAIASQWGWRRRRRRRDRLHLTRLRAENDACFANWARVLALERNQRNSSGLPAASDSCNFFPPSRRMREKERKKEEARSRFSFNVPRASPLPQLANFSPSVYLLFFLPCQLYLALARNARAFNFPLKDAKMPTNKITGKIAL